MSLKWIRYFSLQILTRILYLFSIAISFPEQQTQGPDVSKLSSLKHWCVHVWDSFKVFWVLYLDPKLHHLTWSVYIFILLFRFLRQKLYHYSRLAEQSRPPTQLHSVACKSWKPNRNSMRVNEKCSASPPACVWPATGYWVVVAAVVVVWRGDTNNQ